MSGLNLYSLAFRLRLFFELGLKVRVDLADISLGMVESGSEISYYTVWIG